MVTAFKSDDINSICRVIEIFPSGYATIECQGQRRTVHQSNIVILN